MGSPSGADPSAKQVVKATKRRHLGDDRSRRRIGAPHRLGIDSLSKGGKLIIVGLFGGDITVSTPPFPMRAMTIRGSYVGSLNEMAELLELVRPRACPIIRWRRVRSRT